MAKVKFKALTDAAYKAIQAADIDTNKLYFVTDKGALYKGATLIADVTANSAGAFKYKGTIGSTGATVTTLPAVHEQGWIYIVLTADTYAGKSCQIGDMIVCKASGSVAADTDWDIIPLNFSVVDKAETLAWGATKTIATIDGKEITVALPDNPNTDTKVTSVGNHYTPAENTASALQAVKSSPATNLTSEETAVVTGIKRDAKGHAVGVYTATLKATDTKPTQTNHYTPDTEDANKKQTASGATVPSVGTTQQVIKAIKLDSKGHVVGIESAAVKDTNTDTKVTSTANHYTPASDSSAKKTASGVSPTAGGSGCAIKAITMDAKGHVTGIESVAFGDTMGDLVVAGDPTDTADASDDLDNGEVCVNFLPGNGDVHAHKIEGVNGCEVTYNANKHTILVECTCCEWE